MLNAAGQSWVLQIIIFLTLMFSSTSKYKYFNRLNLDLSLIFSWPLVMSSTCTCILKELIRKLWEKWFFFWGSGHFKVCMHLKKFGLYLVFLHVYLWYGRACRDIPQLSLKYAAIFYWNSKQVFFVCKITQKSQVQGICDAFKSEVPSDKSQVHLTHCRTIEMSMY